MFAQWVCLRFITMRPLGYLAVLAGLLAVVLGCGSSARSRAQGSRARTYPQDHFLPGGIDSLVEGHAPHGPAFAISALRYRFEGKLSSDLQAQMEPHAKPSGASGSFSPSSREPFEWTTEQGCSTTGSWSIVYGLLGDAHDRGTLFIGARRHRLRTVPIPARFHFSGVLGYAALSRNPTRVVVRDAVGKVVQDEDLGRGLGEHCTPGESSSLIVVGTQGG
jgi:hypothetical protein